MGLDALGSASYGPEAALTILAATGAAGLSEITLIIWLILALLTVLSLSYWQTIEAYPSSGGSYVVAKENLGSNVGLLAASALMLDYVLNVAVGISAGVGALTSALPMLHPYTLLLCLVILAVITLINLRGTRESGLAWSLPTYGFVTGLGVILCWGTYQVLAFGGHPRPTMAPPPLPKASEAITFWLLLRAFASGCTAMTGVEAVSNGVSAFREPRVREAHRTLAVIVILLGLLLVGIAHVAQGYGIMAMDQSKGNYQSVLSQIVHAVYGSGWFYYFVMACVLAVLCLSANTSFVGFPRLCDLVAKDGYLPRPFAVPGRRLVYSVGVLFLAAAAGALLIGFDGITDRLIPLFAVGAFVAFTLSQVGMAVHWWRLRKSARDGKSAARALLSKLAINGIGAIATGCALVVILLAKFVEGAWITLLAVPLTISMLKSFRRYYEELDAQMLQGTERPIDLRYPEPPIVLVPLKRWDRLGRKAIEYAVRISPDVVALHLSALEGPDSDDPPASLLDSWHELVEVPAARSRLGIPRLQSIKTEFRSMTTPLLRAIEEVRRKFPHRPITIVLPELVEGHWWGYVMHTHRERRLRSCLLRYGGHNVAISSIPWQLKTAKPEDIIAAEEPPEGPQEACLVLDAVKSPPRPD
jgi:amino acid transporter